MTKLNGINQDPEFFYDEAVGHLLNGDFYEGIRYLSEAIKISKNDDYMIELAEAYFLVEAYAESSKIYYKLSELNLFFGYILAIARNFIHSQGVGVAIEFLKNTIHSGRFSISSKAPNQRAEILARNEELMNLSDTMDRFLAPKKEMEVKSFKKHNDNKEYEKALELCKNEDLEGAALIFESIKPDSSHYKSAIERKIMVYAILKDYENLDKSLKLAKKLRLSFSEINKALIVFDMENDENINELSKDITKEFIKETENCDDHARIIENAMIILDKASEKDLLRLAKKAYELSDCSNESLAFMVYILMAAGKREEANYYLKRYETLYLMDKRTTLFRRLYNENADAKKWLLAYRGMPFFIDCEDSIKKDIFESLELTKKISDEGYKTLDILLLTKQSQKFYEILDVIKPSLNYVTTEYLTDVLLEADVDNEVKSFIISYLLDGKIYMSCGLYFDYVYKAIDLKGINNYKRKAFTNAYAKASLNLIFEYGIYNQSTMEMILRTFNKKVLKFEDENYLAAAMHHTHHQIEGSNGISLDEIAKLYQIDIDILKTYLKELN